MSVTSATVTVARGAGDLADWLIARPRTVLGTLAGVQLVATVVLAFSVEHNGWVYFQGGDQIWLTTQSWLVGQLELPPTELGFLWSFAFTPLMWVTGPTYPQVLPPLVVLQVAVLAPIALLCVYGIAARIGGRLLGYWASFLWVVAPYAVIPLFVDRYHERWTEQFLPQALGLTAMSDFPSMVLVLAAAYFVVRSLDSPALADAVMAGLLLGAATGMKPPNALVGAGVVLAYVVARRWRAGLACGAAVLPGLLVLAFWKDRGLGYVPAISLEEARLAAGAGTVALSTPLDRYVDFDLDHWRAQMNYLREFFWSPRVAQWAPFAGMLAMARARRFAVGALLTGWLAAFLVVKGFSPLADIQANTFWRLLMPAWPAYLLLFASIPVLFPTLLHRLGERVRPPATEPLDRRLIVVVAIATLVLPTIIIAAASPVRVGDKAVLQDDGENSILTPVDETVELLVRRTAGGTSLSWKDGPWQARVFYRVYRTEDAGSDVSCSQPDTGASYCFFRSSTVATTREREWVDPEPVAGATYRIGVGTNWADDPEAGDVFAFSPPAVAGP